MKQRHAFVKLYCHLVFKTWRRMPIIKSIEQEEFLRKLVKSKAHELDCYVLGFGAWLDHLHVVLSYRPSMSAEKFIHDIKGFTAWVWNKEHLEDWNQLKWQDGYWIESLSSDRIKAVSEYANNQRAVHEARNLIPSLEPPDP